MSKFKVKNIQLAVGTDLLASKMSLQASKNTELLEVAGSDIIPGILAVSRSSGRYIKIPYSNLKAVEYYPPEVKEVKKEVK